MIEIEMRKFKDVDLRDGTVVEGFPGVGLVSAISASYLIDSLGLDQVCALDSEDFPPTSMVYDRKPKFPARIYVGAELKLGVFISEFTPPPPLQRPLARKLLEWCSEKKCRRIIATEATPCKCDEGEIGGGGGDREVNVFGIGSTDRAREELDRAGIEQMDKGMIYGVSGVLLNEGRWKDFDVVTLLVEAYEDKPDASAAVAIVEAMDRLTPEFRIDTGPLREQSVKFEEQIRRMREQVEPPMPEAYKSMYQ